MSTLFCSKTLSSICFKLQCVWCVWCCFPRTFLTISADGLIFQMWLSIRFLGRAVFFFLTWMRFHVNSSLLLRLWLCLRAIWKALDDTFVPGSSSGHWILFRNTKAAAEGNIYINSNIKGCHNVALVLQHVSTKQCYNKPKSKIICPHRVWYKLVDCVLFLPPASQTVALTKCPFCAVSFHSDWTNWDLLTANPIHAGTGQSCLGICHPWHRGLPPLS